MKLKAGTYRFIKTPDLSVELSQVFNFTVFYKTALAGDTVVDALAKELLVESDGLTYKADDYSYSLYLNPIPEGYEQYYEDGWGLGYVAEIELNDTEVDETFGTWYIANTDYNEVNAKPLAEITYNGETIAQLNARETCTLKCAGLPMETDIIIKINEVN